MSTHSILSSTIGNRNTILDNASYDESTMLQTKSCYLWCNLFEPWIYNWKKGFFNNTHSNPLLWKLIKLYCTLSSPSKNAVQLKSIMIENIFIHKNLSVFIVVTIIFKTAISKPFRNYFEEICIKFQ